VLTKRKIGRTMPQYARQVNKITSRQEPQTYACEVAPGPGLERAAAYHRRFQHRARPPHVFPPPCADNAAAVDADHRIAAPYLHRRLVNGWRRRRRVATAANAAATPDIAAPCCHHRQHRAPTPHVCPAPRADNAVAVAADHRITDACFCHRHLLHWRRLRRRVATAADAAATRYTASSFRDSRQPCARAPHVRPPPWLRLRFTNLHHHKAERRRRVLEVGEVQTRAFQNSSFSAESATYSDISGYIRWSLLAIRCVSETKDSAGKRASFSGSS